MFVGLLEPILSGDSVEISQQAYDDERFQILAADPSERNVGFFAAYPPARWTKEDEHVHIRDLEPGCRSSSIQLLLRVVGEPTPYLGRMVLVEDAVGVTARFVLFNTNPSVSTSELLPVGTILCVHQVTCETGPGAALKVDHPTDVEFLTIYDARIPEHWIETDGDLTASSWLEKALSAFQEGASWTAYRLFTTGLECPNGASDKLTRIMKLRRAACSMRLHRYSEALEDCKPYLSGPDSVVARRLSAQAFWGLRAYLKALEMFSTTVDDDPTTIAALAIYQSCVDLSLGLSELSLSDVFGERPEEVLVADSLHKVEVRDGKLFLREDVKKGDVIFFEKALVVDEPKSSPEFYWKVPSLSFDSVESAEGSGPSPLAEALLDRLVNNAEYYSPLINQMPRVRLGGDESEVISDVVDTAAVHELVTLHSMALIDLETFAIRPKSASFIDTWKGFFLNYCFLTPTCLPNTRWSIGADVLVVTAAEDLRAGSELTKFIGGVDWAPKELRDAFWHAREHKCNCKICQWDAEHSREQLKESHAASVLLVLETEFDAWVMQSEEDKDTTNKFERSLLDLDEELEAIYRDTEKPLKWQFFRHRIWRNLALIAAARNNQQEYLTWRQKISALDDDHGPCPCLAVCECHL